MTATTPHAEARRRLQLLFIGGWGRSGSTLLDRLVDQAPGFVSVGEMRDLFLRGCVENRLCGCGENFLSCPFWSIVGVEAFGGWDRVDAERLARMRPTLDRPWDAALLLRPELSPSYRARHGEYVDALASVYRAIARVSGAHTIVDSSKIATYALLLRSVPGIDLRFLHLVRDSRGVVFSWRRQVLKPDRPEAPDHMLRYGHVAACARYNLYNGLAEALQFLGLPYLRLRYEDLVQDPRKVLGRVAGHTGTDVASLLGVVVDSSAELEIGHNVDGNPMRFARGRLNIRADEEWRRSMSTLDRRVVSTLTSPMLLRYGYRLWA